MNRACRAVAFACAIAVTSVSGQSTSVDDRIALFAKYLDALRVQAGIPGLSAAVVAGGRIAWERGYGFADLEARVAATPDTPYRIASLTKTFSSVLLMQCREAGRLTLDEPMRTYTTAVPDAAATVRHVLSMTSETQPGTRYRYDGDRFASLTPVVQSCTGEPYRLALASRILNRVGMLDSVPGQDLESAIADASLFDGATLERYRRVIARLAKPYVVTNGRPASADYPPRGINAAAGLISTVRDLARYDAALDDRFLLSRESLTLAWANPTLSDGRRSPYALGWFSQSTAAGPAIWHYGLWPTFSSLLLKFPDRGLTLIMLANSDGLSSRFPLADGDITVSPFARAFIAAIK